MCHAKVGIQNECTLRKSKIIKRCNDEAGRPSMCVIDARWRWCVCAVVRCEVQHVGCIINAATMIENASHDENEETKNEWIRGQFDETIETMVCMNQSCHTSSHHQAWMYIMWVHGVMHQKVAERTMSWTSSHRKTMQNEIVILDDANVLCIGGHLRDMTDGLTQHATNNKECIGASDSCKHSRTIARNRETANATRTSSRSARPILLNRKCVFNT